MLQPLSRLPIAIDPAAIDAAMRPFLVSESENMRWRREVYRRRGSTLARLLTGREAARDRGSIEREYKDAWSAGYQRYRLDRSDLKAKPWHWRGRKLLLDPAAATRLRTVLFAAVLDELKPKRVLEVGSGNGINLLSLAGAYPGVRFTGLELTPEGVEQARHAQLDPKVREIVRAYSPLKTRDPEAVEGIEFIRGDASKMPFEDNSFDLVMTVLAVEQMESIRAAALSEIARVTRHYVLMLEPFRDINASGFRRLYVKSRGYFQGTIGELRGFGLAPLWATADYPQESFLGTALVLAEKPSAARPA
jgi:SAM-dependent methyltransferase